MALRTARSDILDRYAAEALDARRANVAVIRARQALERATIRHLRAEAAFLRAARDETGDAMRRLVIDRAAQCLGGRKTGLLGTDAVADRIDQRAADLERARKREHAPDGRR